MSDVPTRDIKLKTIPASPEFGKLQQEVLDVLKKYEHISAEMILAVLSQMVGQTIALMDQRIYTTDQVMKMVGQNIEIGNAAVLAKIQATAGSA